MTMKMLEKTPNLDKLKWFAVFALLAAGLTANYYYASQPLAFRLIGWLILAIVLALIFFQTERGQQLWALGSEARAEMRKVVWPTRQETLQTTLIVVAMVIIVALFLWGIDSFLLWAIGLLTGQRG